MSEEEPRPGGDSLVLVIENDRELAEETCLDLEAGGHLVQVVETVTEGFRAARSGGAGVLVADRLLDGENGLSIIEALRGEGKWAPALAISGLTSVDERIAGLKAGCDDDLSNPSTFANCGSRPFCAEAAAWASSGSGWAIWKWT